MPKDDLAIHAGIPSRAVQAALAALREDEAFAGVEWKAGKSKPPRPTKIQFEADRIEDLRAAKARLESLLRAAGHELYP